MGRRKQVPVVKQEMTPELWNLWELYVRIRFGDTLILNPKLNPNLKGVDALNGGEVNESDI